MLQKKLIFCSKSNFLKRGMNTNDFSTKYNCCYISNSLYSLYSHSYHSNYKGIFLINFVFVFFQLLLKLATKMLVKCWLVTQREQKANSYQCSVALCFKILVGGILITIDLHIGYMPLFWSCSLIHFNESLPMRGAMRVSPQKNNTDNHSCQECNSSKGKSDINTAIPSQPFHTFFPHRECLEKIYEQVKKEEKYYNIFNNSFIRIEYIMQMIE